MDQPKIERLLRLIKLLIGNKLKTSELAEKLDCDVRTIQRYIDSLGMAGFVIEHRSRGVPFLTAQKGGLKEISDLVHFSTEEAYILHRAIDSIDSNTALKQNLKKKLYNLYNYPWLADVVVKPEQGENVQKLIKAIGDKLCVTLKNYRSANSNIVSDRYVEPYKFTTNYEQIWCYEPSNKMCKIFRISRIGNVILSDQNWMCEKEHKESYIDIFRISNNEYIGNVHITLNLRAYNLLTEEFPLAEKYITPDKNNFFILNAPVCSFEGPARFVLGVFNNVNVHGDKNFIHFINEKIDIIKKI